MSGRVYSYMGEAVLRQIPVGRGLAIAVLSLSLGGCAGLGLPFGEQGTRLTANANSIQPILASATIANQADPSDWDTIRRTIEGAPRTGASLDWNNAITGSIGSITVAAAGSDTCRAFVTTINDVRGIRRYRGEACTAGNGRSQLRGVTADDATLT